MKYTGRKNRFARAARQMLICAVPALFVSSLPNIALAQEALHMIEVPAGDLDTALSQFAADTGIVVYFDASLTRGLTTPGIKGNYRVIDALIALVRGSPLTVISQSDGSYTLKTRDPSIVLPPVKVSAKSTGFDGLPKAYAGGQIARGGNLGVLGNRDIMDTPFHQTNFTQQVVKDQQARTLGDVLRNDPSVQAVFTNNAGIESYSIRGIGASVTINGLHDLAPDADTTAPIVETDERIEVLKGPSALLNGLGPGSSLGGTIILPRLINNEGTVRNFTLAISASRDS